MIDRLVDTGVAVDRCCLILVVTQHNYYKHEHTPTTSTALWQYWLTGPIREIHVAARGTYRYVRVHAELPLKVSEGQPNRALTAV